MLLSWFWNSAWIMIGLYWAWDWESRLGLDKYISISQQNYSYFWTMRSSTTKLMRLHITHAYSTINSICSVFFCCCCHLFMRNSWFVLDTNVADAIVVCLSAGHVRFHSPLAIEKRRAHLRIVQRTLKHKDTVGCATCILNNTIYENLFHPLCCRCMAFMTPIADGSEHWNNAVSVHTRQLLVALLWLLYYCDICIPSVHSCRTTHIGNCLNTPKWQFYEFEIIFEWYGNVQCASVCVCVCA